MSENFLKNGYLKIPNIISNEIKSAFSTEVKSLLSEHSKRRDVHIEATDNSPRYLSNVKQTDIAEYGDIIPKSYHSSEFIHFISKICHPFHKLVANPYGNGSMIKIEPYHTRLMPSETSTFTYTKDVSFEID